MVERWSVVTAVEALSPAGTPAQTLPAGEVTYVIGPLGMLIIVEAGDRPDGNAVQSFDELALREPFPRPCRSAAHGLRGAASRVRPGA